jgi:uncharacterized metal-binding protein
MIPSVFDGSVDWALRMRVTTALVGIVVRLVTIQNYQILVQFLIASIIWKMQISGID